MLFAKKKEPTVYDMAVQELFEACQEYDRAMDAFNRAEDDFFEVANSQLSIAILQKEICTKKVRLLHPDYAGLAQPE